MSFHQQIMLTRYGLSSLGDLHNQANLDPIFTPIFTSIFGGATIGMTGITVASVVSAIATTPVSHGMQMK